MLVFVPSACLAAPLSAQATYSGIGAVVSQFNAQNTHGSVTPPVGVAYYVIDEPRWGRVAAYSVALNPRSKLSPSELKRLVMAELPADAKQVQPWKPALDRGWYCAIYRSSWLRAVLNGTYAVLYASPREQKAAAMVSTAPHCRG
jgi:hypothetical protein